MHARINELCGLQLNQSGSCLNQKNMIALSEHPSFTQHYIIVMKTLFLHINRACMHARMRDMHVKNQRTAKNKGAVELKGLNNDFCISHTQ